MKTYVCSACLTKLTGDTSVCERCGRILDFNQNASLMLIGKKRIFPCSVYITESRLIIRIGDANMENLGIAGVGATMTLEKKNNAYPELDSPWEEISEICYPNGKIGSFFNVIKADCGIIITYVNGAQVAVGMPKKDAVQAAELMKAQLMQFPNQKN